MTRKHVYLVDQCAMTCSWSSHRDFRREGAIVGTIHTSVAIFKLISPFPRRIPHSNNRHPYMDVLIKKVAIRLVNGQQGTMILWDIALRFWVPESKEAVAESAKRSSAVEGVGCLQVVCFFCCPRPCEGGDCAAFCLYRREYL